jgi:hypothetical protein
MENGQKTVRMQKTGAVRAGEAAEFDLAAGGGRQSDLVGLDPGQFGDQV